MGHTAKSLQRQWLFLEQKVSGFIQCFFQVLEFIHFLIHEKDFISIIGGIEFFIMKPTSISHPQKVETTLSPGTTAGTEDRCARRRASSLLQKVPFSKTRFKAETSKTEPPNHLLKIGWVLKTVVSR